MSAIKVKTIPYKKWEKAVEGLELEPERGIRCDKCIKHRLEQTAKYALKEGFDIKSVADPVWFLDPESGDYAKLDSSGHERLINGDYRL